MTGQTKLLYTASVRTTGGREGTSRSSDGRLDIRLSTLGDERSGTNPEQLFAAAWSACFESAMASTARKMNITLSAAPVIDAEVDLNVADGAYFLGARLNVHVPGVDPDVARKLVNAAHQTCPYSKATQHNIPVAVSLV